MEVGKKTSRPTTDCSSSSFASLTTLTRVKEKFTRRRTETVMTEARKKISSWSQKQNKALSNRQLFSRRLFPDSRSSAKYLSWAKTRNIQVQKQRDRDREEKTIWILNLLTLQWKWWWFEFTTLTAMIWLLAAQREEEREEMSHVQLDWIVLLIQEFQSLQQDTHNITRHRVSHPTKLPGRPRRPCWMFMHCLRSSHIILKSSQWGPPTLPYLLWPVLLLCTYWLHLVVVCACLSLSRRSRPIHSID